MSQQMAVISISRHDSRLLHCRLDRVRTDVSQEHLPSFISVEKSASAETLTPFLFLSLSEDLHGVTTQKTEFYGNRRENFKSCVHLMFCNGVCGCDGRFDLRIRPQIIVKPRSSFCQNSRTPKSCCSVRLICVQLKYLNVTVQEKLRSRWAGPFVKVEGCCG
jgi:hypothetical protein